MKSQELNEVETLYTQLIHAWNNRSAEDMAERFANEGEMIGFDGSQIIGKEEIAQHLQPIFASHPTAPFVTKMKSVRFLGEDAIILRAIAGMIPPGQSDINPNVNTHHTLISVKHGGQWKIELFQNTPAQFHGREDLVQEFTEELRELIPKMK
jgi:uncharacterized protein (TIGR02246 family)